MSSCSFQPLVHVSQCICNSPMEQSKYPQLETKPKAFLIPLILTAHLIYLTCVVTPPPPFKNALVSRCCRQVQSSKFNDVIQKNEKRLNNTQTTTQKQTNNDFHHTNKQGNEVYLLHALLDKDPITECTLAIVA